ncbi:hypothetical protein BpHYR1_016378 [Brachionus plicatilis]|uniref:Uncharacterized protein n=1 Tax=Brachionus plicatilis TaxID=10195 RepID=A0A3M7SX24_BRAPC|nr:hypothetical protein BpHYR1_016378 [Brachionus plicatilis]
MVNTDEELDSKGSTGPASGFMRQLTKSVLVKQLFQLGKIVLLSFVLILGQQNFKSFIDHCKAWSQFGAYVPTVKHQVIHFLITQFRSAHSVSLFQIVEQLLNGHCWIGTSAQCEHFPHQDPK